MRVQDRRKELAEFIRHNSTMTWMEVAIQRGVSIATITRVAKEFNLSRPTWKVVDKTDHVEMTQETL